MTTGSSSHADAVRKGVGGVDAREVPQAPVANDGSPVLLETKSDTTSATKSCCI